MKLDHIASMQAEDSRDLWEIALDDILCRWHQWAAAAKYGRGFNRKSLVTGEFRISRQYDDQNGALDEQIENGVMKDVDFQVSEMVDPHRAAIYANARALVYGCSVFSSARLPADRFARLVIVTEARFMLRDRLTDAGIM